MDKHKSNCPPPHTLKLSSLLSLTFENYEECCQVLPKNNYVPFYMQNGNYSHLSSFISPTFSIESSPFCRQSAGILVPAFSGKSRCRGGTFPSIRVHILWFLPQKKDQDRCKGTGLGYRIYSIPIPRRFEEQEEFAPRGFEEKDEFIIFFKIVRVQNSQCGKELNKFCPPNSSDDLCLLFLFILLLWFLPSVSLSSSADRQPENCERVYRLQMFSYVSKPFTEGTVRTLAMLLHAKQGQ